MSTSDPLPDKSRKPTCQTTVPKTNNFSLTEVVLRRLSLRTGLKSFVNIKVPQFSCEILSKFSVFRTWI